MRKYSKLANTEDKTFARRFKGKSYEINCNGNGEIIEIQTDDPDIKAWLMANGFTKE
jgi:hypothetical protein